MLNQTTFDPELDKEIERKTIAGTLAEDEKAWIATYNSLWTMMGSLHEAIEEEFEVGKLLND